jgi:hypothetical protein
MFNANGYEEESENAIHDFYRNAINHIGFTLEHPPCQWPRILTYHSQAIEKPLFHSLANKLRPNDLPKKIAFSSQAVLSIQKAIKLPAHHQLVTSDSLQMLLHTIYLSGVQSGEVGAASFLNRPGLVWMRL